ncbi:MAG: hypothetical protein AB9879_06420 [Methanothrix sp.]
MPTSRNARGIDIIAYSTDSPPRVVMVQVKALSKRNPVPVGTRLDKIMGDFWVIVIDVLEKPRAFVMQPSEITDRVHRGEKDGRVSYWLQPASYDQEDFLEKWDRIGHGDRIPEAESVSYKG